MKPEEEQVLITTKVEMIAGRECVVVASTADPKICNVFTPRDPEFVALRRKASVS